MNPSNLCEENFHTRCWKKGLGRGKRGSDFGTLGQTAGLQAASHQPESLFNPKYKVRETEHLNLKSIPSILLLGLGYTGGSTHLHASWQEEKKEALTLVAPFLLSVSTNPH